MEIKGFGDKGAEGLYILSVAISPDGSLVATGMGASDNRVLLWNTTTGNVQELGRHQSIVTSVAFNPSGTLLASGDNGNEVWIQDLKNPSAITVYKGDVPNRLQNFTNLYWLDDQTILAAGTYAIYTWDTSTKRLLKRLAIPDKAPFFVDAAFDQGGNRIAAAAQDNVVYVWDQTTAAWSTWPALPTSKLAKVAFSSDGQLLAAGTQEGNLLLWDTTQDKLLVECSGPTDSIVALRFSPDNHYIAAVGWDATIWLWGIP